VITPDGETCDWKSGVAFYASGYTCSANKCIAKSTRSCVTCATKCTYSYKACSYISDGCCPAGCTTTNDRDCASLGIGNMRDSSGKIVPIVKERW
jgi:hypothetical protein